MSDLKEINEKLNDEMQVSLSQNQYLTFMLDSEQFAMPVVRIREIIEFDQITVVPTAPRIFRGVINLRGRIVPVIDLARKFGLKESPITSRTCIIVLDIDMDDEVVTIGSMVDKVLLVQDINSDAIDSAPDLGTVIDHRFVKGIGKVDGKFISILHIDHIFAEKEVVCMSSFSAAGNSHPEQTRHTH